MAISQPLMALMSTDVRLPESGAVAANAHETRDGSDFARLLAAQMPEELQPAISQLSAEQLALLEQATLAAGGKSLPPVQDWLEPLPREELTGEPVAEDALGAIAQWLGLLQAAPLAVAAEPLSSGTGAAPPVSLPAAPGIVQVAGDRDAAAVMTSDSELPSATDDSGQNRRTQGERELAARDVLTSADVSRAPRTTTATQVQDIAAAQQRMAVPVNNEPVAPAAAMLGKLAEQLERAGGATVADERDGLEALTRSLQPGTAAAALSARPVTAASQSLGVPFGQAGWSEATVEKVMWMSSQNLRSVEIRLDPAELGPMEIHIQHRGQELQVQLVSQNPAVREALEAQMHRLREMFGQQGLEQAQVTVADRSPGEQSGQRQSDEQLAQQAAQGQPNLTGAAGADVDVEAATDQPTQRWSSPRLIDYYA